jgi:hypothetical protein
MSQRGTRYAIKMRFEFVKRGMPYRTKNGYRFGVMPSGLVLGSSFEGPQPYGLSAAARLISSTRLRSSWTGLESRTAGQGEFQNPTPFGIPRTAIISIFSDGDLFSQPTARPLQASLRCALFILCTR